MQPTLVILAAGMASRYGSMKQIQGFGPSVVNLNAMPASAVKTDARIIGEINKYLQK